MPLKLQKVKVAEVIKSCLAQADSGLKEKGLELRTSIADDLPPVKADRDIVA